MIVMKTKFWVAVLFLAFHFFCASSQSPSTTGWLNIDCGIETPRVDTETSLDWVTDDGVIKSGTNKFVSEKQELDEMNTLRSFPKGKKNCYNLKVYQEKVRYLIRAGFFYGNYDGLSSPPTVELHLDGKKWTTVKTSMTEDPVYREAIHEARSDHISLCIVRVKDGGVPFISSIEVVPLDVNAAFPLYRKMESSLTYNLETRVNLGGKEVRYEGGGEFSDEEYNQIWTYGKTPQNCKPAATDSDSNIENDPPDEVIIHSIESKNSTDPITLSVDISQTPTPQSAYVVLYFAEKTTDLQPGDTRIVQIYIDQQMTSTVTLEYNKLKVKTLYPVIPVGRRMSVTLASDSDSKLPPLITAMEVFTTSSAPILHCRFFCPFINFVISCTCLFLFLA